VNSERLIIAAAGVRCQTLRNEKNAIISM